MNGSEGSNDHHTTGEPAQAVNSYADVLTGRPLPEIAEGAKSVRTGHPYLLAISVFLLLVFFVPVIIQVIRFSH